MTEFSHLVTFGIVMLKVVSRLNLAFAVFRENTTWIIRQQENIWEDLD